ncbi:MAG: hypothetical protein ACO20H_09610 [Bacteriovoracaceae bacterium]
MDKENKKEVRLGYFYFFLFVAFITAGIIHKRVYNGPEFMMLWHLPGAVFLVLAGKNLTKHNRSRYYQTRE